MLILLPDVERLEFTGSRLADGKLTAFGNSAPMDNWPEEITVCPAGIAGYGVKFRLEESDDRAPDEGNSEGEPEGSAMSQAWYVPA